MTGASTLPSTQVRRVIVEVMVVVTVLSAHPHVAGHSSRAMSPNMFSSLQYSFSTGQMTGLSLLPSGQVWDVIVEVSVVVAVLVSDTSFDFVVATVARLCLVSTGDVILAVSLVVDPGPGQVNNDLESDPDPDPDPKPEPESRSKFAPLVVSGGSLRPRSAPDFGSAGTIVKRPVGKPDRVVVKASPWALSSRGIVAMSGYVIGTGSSLQRSHVNGHSLRTQSVTLQ